VFHVESEHSAMGACIGVSMEGARSFTATSSNGALYMAENIVSAGLYRLPIVMQIVNRTLGPEWNIWTEQGDSLMFRDWGWMQVYCENNQELIYKLEVEEIKDVYMAHIHIGPSDKQGPIAVWLYPLNNQDNAQRCIEGEFNGTLAEGTIKQEDIKEGITFNELIEAMRNGNAYVNVHTKKFMPGEIRGQVHPKI